MRHVYHVIKIISIPFVWNKMELTRSHFICRWIKFFWKDFWGHFSKCHSIIFIEFDWLNIEPIGSDVTPIQTEPSLRISSLEVRLEVFYLLICLNDYLWYRGFEIATKLWEHKLILCPSIHRKMIMNSIIIYLSILSNRYWSKDRANGRTG